MPAPRLSMLPKPFIVSVITNRTVPAAIATMRASALDGAHAFEINLPPFGAEQSLGEPLSAVPGAIYTSCRRREFMRVYGFADGELPDWSDDERMERQLVMIEHGSVAIDIEMDTFDPHPAPPLGSVEAERFAAAPGSAAELTIVPVAIRRQRELIREVNDRGAEALLSCHTGRPQTVDALLAIATEAVARGANLLKIVTPCRDRRDLFAVLDATARLAGSLPIPFTLIGAGTAGQLSRVIGANFGSSWLIGQHAFIPGGFHGQPLVSQLRDALRLIPWQVERETTCA